MSDIEKLLAGAGAEGWDFFNGVSSEIRDRVELERAKTEEQRVVIARAWARFADSPDGAQALDLLFASTLQRTVFFVNLQLPPDQTLAWGTFREGQNALAHEIARQIAAGRRENQPKPRDVE